MIEDSELLSSGIEEAHELLELAKEARNYLLYHSWCKGIYSLSYAMGFSKVAVFHATIEPRKGESPTIWVVVGDIPPLHMDTEYCETALDALTGYVELMEDLCEAVKRGASIEDLPPLRERRTYKILAPATQLIGSLEKRLVFIRKNLIDALSM